MRKIILIFMVLVVSLYADTNSNLGDLIKWKYQYTMKNRPVLEKDITDGDTFEHTYNRWEHTIRLYGIDAPETKKDKAISDLEVKYGLEAKAFLTSMLTSRKVNITIVGPAAYCREAGIVTIGQGKNELNVNEEMVRVGLALVDERYCKNKSDRDRLLKIQTQASNNQAGFWSDKNYYPVIEEKIKNYQSKNTAVKK